MNVSVRRIRLSQDEIAYLRSVDFFPQELLRHIQQDKSHAKAKWHLILPVAEAERLRDVFTEQLARVGFDESYELTKEGALLEELIDSFQG